MDKEVQDALLKLAVKNKAVADLLINYNAENKSVIEEAKAKIDAVAKETGDWGHYTAYGRYGLDSLLGNGNRYDTSLYDMKESIEEAIAEEACS